MIHGGADTLVPTAGSEPLARLPGVERRVLPELRHETLNEPEGPQVVARHRRVAARPDWASGRSRLEPPRAADARQEHRDPRRIGGVGSAEAAGQHPFLGAGARVEGRYEKGQA